MSTAPQPAVDQNVTLEQKILAASSLASQVVTVFSPQVALLIKAGVDVEPAISGIVQYAISIFRHHATKK